MARDSGGYQIELLVVQNTFGGEQHPRRLSACPERRAEAKQKHQRHHHPNDQDQREGQAQEKGEKGKEAELESDGQEKVKS